MHILAANGRPAMKCWEWQLNKQFPHSNCNFVIRMDSSVDDKNIRHKFFSRPKSSGTLLGRLPLNSTRKPKKSSLKTVNHHRDRRNIYLFFIFLDFHSTKKDCHWLILGHVASTKLKCRYILQGGKPQVHR